MNGTYFDGLPRDVNFEILGKFSNYDDFSNYLTASKIELSSSDYMILIKSAYLLFYNFIRTLIDESSGILWNLIYTDILKSSDVIKEMLHMMKVNEEYVKEITAKTFKFDDGVINLDYITDLIFSIVIYLSNLSNKMSSLTALQIDNLYMSIGSSLIVCKKYDVVNHWTVIIKSFESKIPGNEKLASLFKSRMKVLELFDSLMGR